MSADELVLAASAANLPAAQSYVEEHLEAVDCPLRVRMQIALAVERRSYGFPKAAGNNRNGSQSRREIVC